jgi:DNA repair protein RadC
LQGRLKTVVRHSEQTGEKIVKSVFETRFARIGETGEHYQAVKINSTAAACQWAKDSLGSYFDERLDCEEFLIAILNTKLCVQRVVRITRGTLDASLVHPREVFRPAIADAAAAILLIHNHPSGDPTPSPQDREITDRLKKCGEMLGINVIDHIIVGQNCAVSLAEC